MEYILLSDSLLPVEVLMFYVGDVGLKSWVDMRIGVSGYYCIPMSSLGGRFDHWLHLFIPPKVV